MKPIRCYLGFHSWHTLGKLKLCKLCGVSYTKWINWEGSDDGGGG